MSSLQNTELDGPAAPKPANGMALSWLALLTGAGWTIGAFAAGQIIRLLLNATLARLLAPELFGTMLLIHSLRLGVDLLSDVGIGQNVVVHSDAHDTRYYNTAWSLQVLRGIFVFCLCCILARPLSQIYGSPLLAVALPLSALYFVAVGFYSIGLYLAQKRLKIGLLNRFDLTIELLSAIIHVVAVLISPTVWSLIIAGLLAVSTRTLGSYFLIPSIRPRFAISPEYAWQIVGFGKWIFLSSTVYYFAMTYDRLYLAKVAPLAVLGIYGIARTFADLVTTLVQKLNSLMVFPLIASSAGLPREELRAQVAGMRWYVLLAAAAGLALFVALADLPIVLLYDQRYQSAGWMIAVLATGAWIPIVCGLNESSLLGLKRPIYGAIANAAKFAWLFIGLPLAYAAFGVVGVIGVVALSDISRYAPIMYGQIRERFSFGAQDAAATGVLLVLIVGLEFLRRFLGFGTSFDSLAQMLGHSG